MNFRIYIFCLLLVLTACLSDKADGSAASVQNENPILTGNQNSNSEPLSNQSNAVVGKTSENTQNGSAFIMEANNQDDTGQIERSTDQNTDVKLGNWELLRTVERPGITAISIAAWLKYAIIADNKKDSAFIINHKEDFNFDSLQVPDPKYITVSKSRLLLPSIDEGVVYVFRGNDLYPLETFTDLAGPVAAHAYSLRHYMMLDQVKAQLIFKKEGIENVIGGGILEDPINFEVVDTSTFYILDNGNKSVHVFNENGDQLFNFGQDQNFENATGITSDSNRIFVSDFDKAVIYIYTHQGVYLGKIDEHINNPSDLDWKDNVLYIANQNGPEIVLLRETDPDY